MSKKNLEIREIQAADLNQLLVLYTYLHNNPMPEIDNGIRKLWEKILIDKDHHIVVGIADEKIVSSCVLVVIQNLTYGQKPYALIENVITHEDYRNRGYATQVLDFAKDIAIGNECYKIMLLTGSKQEKTLAFYENAGYNQNDKTAFIQWLI